MIIACAGMYRAGSTWQYNVARLLVPPGAWTGYAHGTDHLKQIIDENEHAVIKCHPFRCELVEHADLILTCHRDIRDVAASSIRVWGKDQPDFIKKLDIYIRSYNQWAERASLDQKYERMVQNKIEGAKDIASAFIKAGLFSLYELPIGFAKEICEQIDALTHDEDTPHPKTLMHKNHRSKRVGRYRKIVPKEMIKAIEQKYAEWLTYRGYELGVTSGV